MVKKRWLDREANPQIRQYRLIFMDYSMPYVDGIEASINIFEQFRSRGFQPDDFIEWPYICCLSAYSDDTFIERAKRVGV